MKVNKPDKLKNFIMAGQAFLYTSKLLDALHAIPAEPPKNLSEADFKKIQRRWRSIIRKMRFFTDDGGIK